MSAAEIFRVLTGGDVSEMTRRVFMNLRLPRTVMALLSGLGLGLAGSVFQMIFRNPLAAPDIVGVTSGANLGAALAIILFGNIAVFITVGKFILLIIGFNLTFKIILLTIVI